MSVISKCPGVGCHLKQECKRFRVVPSWNQSWHGYDMLRVADDPMPECFIEYISPKQKASENAENQ